MELVKDCLTTEMTDSQKQSLAENQTEQFKSGHRWRWSFYHQWNFLPLNRMRWIDFTIINVRFEIAPYRGPGCFEFCLGFMGLGVIGERIPAGTTDE